jgi:hypothetical protein
VGRLLAVAAIPALFYLPGHFAWRLGERGGARDAPGHLLLEILLSVVAATIAGLLLGILGWFSLGRLTVVLLVVTAALAAAARGHPRTGAGGGRYRVDLLAGGVVCGAAAVLFHPPFDLMLYGADSTVYLSVGAHLAEQGSAAIDDPLLHDLSRFERHLLFERQPGPAGPYYRSLTGLAFQPDGATVSSTFTLPLSLWVAIFTSLGGIDAAPHLATVFAALGLWAVALVAGTGRSWILPLAAIVLLATSLPEYLFARVLMPEILAQFFLWGGLLAFGRWCAGGDPLAGGTAAASFALAGSARLEYIGLVPLGLLLYRLVVGPIAAPRNQLPALVVVYAAVAGIGMLDLARSASHYPNELGLRMQTASDWLRHAPVWQLAGAAAATALGARAVAWVLAGRREVRLRLAIVALLCADAGVYASLSFGQPPTVPGWLALRLPPPVLVVTGVGAVIVLARWRNLPAALQLACCIGGLAAAHFLYDPHTLPYPLWAARRFVPVALPVFLILAAVPLAALSRRRLGLPVALAVLGAATYLNLGMLGPVLGPRYAGATRQVREFAALLPADALVLYDTTVQETGIDVPAWLVFGREGVMLPAAPRGSAALRILVRRFGLRRPIFFVGHAWQPPPDLDGLDVTPHGTFDIVTLPVGPAPDGEGKIALRKLPLAIYRITAAPAGSGA